MSNTPKVTVAFSNGNLLKNIPEIDGKIGFIGTGKQSGNLNKVFFINSLVDAVDQGITPDDEPAAYKVIKEFYQELGGNQEICVLLVDEDITMTDMVDSNEPAMISKLITEAGGKLSLIGIFRKPPVGYDPGSDFLDLDVENTLSASRSLIDAQNVGLKFMRLLIEGRIADEDSTTIFEPNTATNGGAGVVLGDTVSGSGAAVGLAMGRAAKYASHIKIGKVSNGALTASEIYIGTRKLENVTNLDALHGKGYISFVTYPGKAGYFFGIDNMASDDDYRILVHGRVVDAAARVAASVYIDELESEVDTNPDGTIKELDAKALEDKIVQQANVTLGDRISGIEALVDRTLNIINTNRVKIKIRVRPKGYLTFIDVDLGLTAGA